MKGPFNLWYAITGKKPDDPAQPWSEDYMKAMGAMVKIGVIIIIATIFIAGAFGIGSMVWRMFRPSKPLANTASATFQGPTGSGSQNIKYTVVQIGEKSKLPIRVVPYIDANTGYSDRPDSFASSGQGWQILAGVRLEMDGLFEQWFGGKKTTTQNVVEAVNVADAVKDVSKVVAVVPEVKPSK